MSSFQNQVCLLQTNQHSNIIDAITHKLYKHTNCTKSDKAKLVSMRAYCHFISADTIRASQDFDYFAALMGFAAFSSNDIPMVLVVYARCKQYSKVQQLLPYAKKYKSRYSPEQRSFIFESQARFMYHTTRSVHKALRYLAKSIDLQYSTTKFQYQMQLYQKHFTATYHSTSTEAVLPEFKYLWHYFKAQVYMHDHQYTLALQELNFAIRDKPNYAVFYHDRAYCCLYLKNDSLQDMYKAWHLENISVMYGFYMVRIFDLLHKTEQHTAINNLRQQYPLLEKYFDAWSKYNVNAFYAK